MYAEGREGHYLRMIPVTVQRAVPLRAFQSAIICSRLAVGVAGISIQSALQVKGKHLPLGCVDVPVEQVVLRAAVLRQKHRQHRHCVDCLRGMTGWLLGFQSTGWHP